NTAHALRRAPPKVKRRKFVPTHWTTFNFESKGSGHCLFRNMSFKLLLSFLVCFCLAAGAQETDIRRDATVNAVEQVMPSVVNIATKSQRPVRNVFDQFQRQMLHQPM